MSIETTGYTLAFADALDRIAEEDGCDMAEWDDGPCMQCEACICAESASMLRVLHAQLASVKEDRMHMSHTLEAMLERAEARLDWLEKNAVAGEGERRGLGAHEKERGQWVFRLWNADAPGFTDHDDLREAVDAAMEDAALSSGDTAAVTTQHGG